MLETLDIFFVAFHTIVIIFNLFGWMWRRTRVANLALLSLTAFSWFVLGIWYGIGYCPLTDWHWDVLRALGHTAIPHSYVKYLVDRVLGIDLDAGLVDAVVLAAFILALSISLGLNIRDWRRK